MKRPAYPKYKPSRIEWLGDVPEHWEVRRLKTAATYRVSNVDKVPAEDEEPVRLCNYTDVYYNDHITPEMALMETTATPEEIKKFSDAESQKSEVKSQKRINVSASKFFKDGSIWLLLGILITILITISVNEIDYGLYVLFVSGAAFGILQIISGYLVKNNKTENGFVVVLTDLYNMPKTMKQLAVVQSFRGLHCLQCGFIQHLQ